MITASSLGSGQTLVAVFPDRHSARDAADELADAAYHRTRVAATRSADTADSSTASSTTTIVHDGDMLEKIVASSQAKAMPRLPMHCGATGSTTVDRDRRVRRPAPHCRL